MSSPRDALEAALVRTPDDVALHMAYADCLIEEGDPRGEYLRLCLAAEEPGGGKKESKQRYEAAEGYRLRHERDWLGRLHEFVISSAESRRRFVGRPRIVVEWRRGWIAGVTCINIRGDLIEALRTHPLTTFLESLAIDAYSSRRPGRQSADTQILRTGQATYPYQFLAEWPRPTLRRLFIQDPEFGDEGIAVLAASAYFPRLQSLSLMNCCITDDGAEMLAAHPHTPKLASLRLEQNLISPLGIEALAAIGVKVSELQRFGRLEDV